MTECGAEVRSDPAAGPPRIRYADRVLLVEDDENDIELFRRALRAADPALALDLATDGESAVNWLTEQLADCDCGRRILPRAIYLDIRLPGMTGLEVLRWVRSQPELDGAVAVVCTADERPDDEAEAQRLGADAFRRKPADATELRLWLATASREAFHAGLAAVDASH